MTAVNIKQRQTQSSAKKPGRLPPHPCLSSLVRPRPSAPLYSARPLSCSLPSICVHPPLPGSSLLVCALLSPILSRRGLSYAQKRP